MNIAYNKEWLRNLDVIKHARTWRASGLITKDQHAEIARHYTAGFFHPNLFIRIALFLATSIALGGVTGLLGLMFVDAFNRALGILCLVYGAGSLLFLDKVFVQENYHYKSGVNEALLYHSLGFIIAGLSVITDSDERGILSFCFVMLVFSAYRYLDLISALGAIFCFGYFIFLILYEKGGLVQQLIPVIMIIIFTPVYFFARKLKEQKSTWPWADVLLVAEAVSLMIVYAAGNYFVVRELSVSMMGLEILEGEDIPFAFVFYGLTVMIPVLYLYFGIRKKDIVLIRVSLVAIAFSVFTFKYYFSLGHHEITLTVGGIVLLAIAFILFRYLRTPRQGYTRDNLMTEKWAEANPEAILISQTMGGNKAVVEEGFQGQGGGFGGGGASGGY